MKPVTRNLIANFVGRGWAFLINLIVAPLLIKLLGIESYGLIGFYTTLYGVINLLDFGVSPTINRELAQYSVDETQNNRGRDLVRTLEIGYWMIGILLGITVFWGAPIIANNWLQTSKLPIDALVYSIRLMGFLVVLEWPFTFYQGSLLGLQKHVLLNAINITNSLLKFGGALIILKFISPTIDAFFTWQIIVSTVIITLEIVMVWRNLPHSEGRPHFDLHLLERIWKFALSLNLISFISLIINQMDKVLVSHYFTLDIFGYYNLATMVSGGFTFLVSPFNLTYFPRLSTLVAQKDEIGFRRVYHQSCQLVSVSILPAATIGALYAEKIIQIWTGNPSIASKTAPIATLLIIGTAIHSLSNMPYYAQIAHGWTRLSLTINIISLPLILLLIFALKSLFGIYGVAGMWVVYNLALLCTSVPLMHRRILQGEFGTWFWKDAILPLFVCMLFAGVILLLEYFGIEMLNSIPWLLVSSIFIEAVILLIVPFTREKAFAYIRKFLNSKNHENG
jgi:O-antigen/teichoic acid export membrane protein